MVVDREQECRLPGLAHLVRPERRLGDRQEPPRQLDQRLAQVAAGGQEVDGADDLERRDLDDRLLLGLRRPELRDRLHGRVGHGEQDRIQVDLRVGRPDRRAVPAELLDGDLLEDQERVLGEVEDVGHPVLPGADRPARDQRVGVQGQLGSAELLERRVHAVLRACAPRGAQARREQDTRPAARVDPRIGSRPRAAGPSAWRSRSPGARPRAGGPRTGGSRWPACRPPREACPGAGARSAGTGARTPTCAARSA